MQKRTLKVAVLAVLTVCLVLGMSSVALADQTWSDLPDWVTAKYGVDDNQVAGISEGYPDGTWKPFQSVTRAQFTKMEVAAFNIPLVTPAVPSFTDVAPSSLYYPYIEGAKAAGIANGTSATTYSPNANITRQQALALVARYVAGTMGYDDTADVYSAAEIDALLAHFGDKDDISADLKDEVAFAYDYGLTVGDDYGNLNPLANLTRIQGAVLLIRAQALVPPQQWTPANLEITTADKAENLIGQVHPVTIKVTTAEGHPAKNVLVDLDTLTGSDYYVGNISPQAAVTDSMGEVTVNLISTEPGTQRISATVAGVGTKYYTKYWVALDEVYMLCADEEEDYEYNAGTTTQALEARAVVFGPGPLSTSAQDWYNAYMPEATGALAAVDWPIGWVLAQINQFYRDVLPIPGEEIGMDDLQAIIDWANEWAEAHQDLIMGIITADSTTQEILELVNVILAIDRWSCAVEALANAHGYLPRGLAGISMYWTIINAVEDNPNTVSTDETVPSVGDIVEVDGTAITAAKSAVGTTDATGMSSVKLMSEETGLTKIQVVADYAGNPYPAQLFNHLTHQVGLHFLDWDDQPYGAAVAVLTWIPHVIGGDDAGPISAANLVNNTGEVEEFTLNLTDVYGNAIAGYTVVWWIEGVGFFKTDESSWTGIGETNKDFDVTDMYGKASVWVKSLVPGQTVVHCKVMDKYGSTYKEWNLTKQWYSIDDVEFVDKNVWTDYDDDGKVDVILVGAPNDSELGPPVNPVGSEHTFTVKVSGAKYVHVLYDVNLNGLLDDVVLLGKRADIKAANGAVIAWAGPLGYPNMSNALMPKYPGDDILPGQVFTPDAWDEDGDGVLDVMPDPSTPDNFTWYTRFADTALSGAEYWDDKAGLDFEPADPDMDYINEVWSGLAGKNVYFYTNIGNCEAGILDDTPLPIESGGGAYPDYVGVITDPTANPVVSDDMGEATVTITSDDKGFQYVFAIADYLENPQDGDPLDPFNDPDDPDDGTLELRWDCAMKMWVTVGVDDEVRIYAQGEQQSDLRWANPIMADPALNVDRIYVQVFDKYGNALEGYKVTFEIVGQGTITNGTCNTYHPFAHFDYQFDTGLNETITPAHDWYEVVPGPFIPPFWVGPLPPENDIMHWAGVGDLNPFWNSNLLWGDFNDGMHPDYAHDANDDDYAWGWTLNDEIDFTFNEASAAYADLVLDETLGALQAILSDEGLDVCDITSIVNIKVYRPDGSFWKQYEVTKVWSLDVPALDSIFLQLSPISDAGPWYTAVGPTTLQPVYYRVFLYDQYGDPFTTPTDLCLRAAGTSGSWTQTTIVVDPITGIGTGTFTPTIPAGFTTLGVGVWNFVAFDDAVTLDDQPSVGEIQSNLCTYEIE